MLILHNGSLVWNYVLIIVLFQAGVFSSDRRTIKVMTSQLRGRAAVREIFSFFGNQTQILRSPNRLNTTLTLLSLYEHLYMHINRYDFMGHGLVTGPEVFSSVQEN